MVSHDGNVCLQLLDVSGKLYAEFHDALEAGTHCFEVSAANPRTYLLKAVAGSKKYSIRMVNIGMGCSNSIHYEGLSSGIMAKLTSDNQNGLENSGVGTHGRYRTSSICDPNSAWSLHFDPNIVEIGSCSRSGGRIVRTVRPMGNH